MVIRLLFQSRSTFLFLVEQKMAEDPLATHHIHLLICTLTFSYCLCLGVLETGPIVLPNHDMEIFEFGYKYLGPTIWNSTMRFRDIYLLGLHNQSNCRSDTVARLEVDLNLCAYTFMFR